MRPEAKDRDSGGLITRIGPFEIDWLKSLVYAGSIGLALACELLAPRLGKLLAAIPVLELCSRAADTIVGVTSADDVRSTDKVLGVAKTGQVLGVANEARRVRRAPKRARSRTQRREELQRAA